METETSSTSVNIVTSTTDQPVLIKQGAESRIYSCYYRGRPAIAKERFAKKYRHPELDRLLIGERMKGELRALVRCRSLGLRVPAVFFVDSVKNIIVMEYITPSVTVRERICQVQEDTQAATDEASAQLAPLAVEIGRVIAVLHKNNIVHGDLTTSNMLVTEKEELVLIDFGLSSVTPQPEPKGVDLYVLEKAILSTHPNSEQFFAAILSSYGEHWPKKGDAVLKKLDDIRLRGRKRDMIG